MELICHDNPYPSWHESPRCFSLDDKKEYLLARRISTHKIHNNTPEKEDTEKYEYKRGLGGSDRNIADCGVRKGRLAEEKEKERSEEKSFCLLGQTI